MKQEDLVSSVAVALLLIGTATGSAVAMMILSGATLAVLLILHRSRLKQGIVWVVLVAAVVAMLMGIALALQQSPG